jgi:DNA primase
MRTVYEIRDTAGVLVAEHVRIDLDDGSKRVRWQVPGGDPKEGLMGLPTAQLPLYGSENIRTFETGQVVVVTEGEKAAEALWLLGIDALGTVTGAACTPDEDALSVLLPFDVVLWPDHDDIGEKHMRNVASRLIRLGGHARRIEWGSNKGDDAADFLGRGGTIVTVDLLIQAADWYRLETPRERAVRATDYPHDGEWRVETARSQIARVVEDRLGPPRRRVGRSLLWRCPFHDERTASFKVDLKEPFFRCFGCDARGDVFQFLERMDGAGFRDVLRELAPERLLGAAIPW